MNLRDYQVAGRKSVFREWMDVDSTLVVFPTGLGKTILIADIIRCAFPSRALVIAHREELIFQARDKISRVTKLRCDIEMGEYSADENSLLGRAPVVVSTIQTLTSGGDGGGRMGKFDPAKFGVLIVDEAHHAAAPSYKRVLNYFQSNPKLKILGVTATPDRADEQALGQVFQTVAADYEILDAINDGWLVPIQQQMVNVQGLDFSSIRTTAGDLNGADLAAVMEAERNCHEIAGASIDIIGSKRALVFTSSVKHAEMTAEIFNRHQPGMAAWVCGKTDKDERRKILKDFADGKLQVVANCLDEKTQILTRRGWTSASDIKPQDVTATFNAVTGRIEWKPISRIVSRDRNRWERMVAIKNQTFNARVTEGHKMVLRVAGAKAWKFVEACTLPCMPSAYEMPISAIDYSLPGVSLSDAEIEFLGLFATDGSLNIKRASIEICQAKIYETNCQEIERILTECGFDWKRTGGGNYYRYRIPKGTIGGQLQRNGWGRIGDWINKSLDPRLESMTTHQFERLIYGLWLGDGDKHYVRNKKRKNTGIRICGIDWLMFDRVQAWAVVRGWASNLSIRPNTSCGKHPNSILGHLSLRKRQSVCTNNKHVLTSGGNPSIFDIDYKTERVWCVTNENGTIITRREGRVLIMGQCGVLTEGFDDPGVEVIIMGRPTKSRALYSQMVGRSTRPLPGIVDGPETPEERREAIAASAKPSALIVDFVGNSGKHKLMTSADILGGNVSDEVVERAIIRARKAGRPVDMKDLLNEEEKLLKEEKRLAEEARKAKLVARAKYKVQEVDPFDVLQLHPVKPRGWDGGKVLTEKQRGILQKQGINPDSVPYSQARQLVSEIISRWDKNLASFKQAKILKRFGYGTDVSFQEASRIIDALAKNGWRKVEVAA